MRTLLGARLAGSRPAAHNETYKRGQLSAPAPGAPHSRRHPHGARLPDTIAYWKQKKKHFMYTDRRTGPSDLSDTVSFFLMTVLPIEECD